MRTNVVIDDELMSRAMRSSGCRTKRSTIESGLRLLVQVSSQKKLRSLKGINGKKKLTVRVSLCVSVPSRGING